MEPEESNPNSDSWESMSTDSDPESVTAKLLDIRSPRFSPKLALRCKNLKLPDPNAPTCFSIAQFQAKVPCLSKPILSPKKKSNGNLGRNTKVVEPQPTASSSGSSAVGPGPGSQASDAPYYPIPGRRFLPHQMPVYVPKKQLPNVLTLMETMGGPFSALDKARRDGSRIKVWTRNAEGFRGYSLGTILAFDKHWNLVLRDVDEVIQRKRKIKVPLVPKNINQESLTEERNSFKSGQLLSAYSKMTTGKPKIVQPGRKTDYFVESPDALDLCRRIGAISLNSPKNPIYLPRAKAGTNETKPSKSQLRKKRLVILQQPYVDGHGHKVVAQSHLYEIVERHIAQMLLMGDNVIFIETHPK